MITSCGSLQKRLEAAAARQGVAKADTLLPDMPADCRKEEPHTALYAGKEALVALRQEFGALDRANARIRRCNGRGGFYDELKTGLEAKP